MQGGDAVQHSAEAALRNLTRQSLRRSASVLPVPRAGPGAVVTQATAGSSGPRPATAAGRQSLWPRRSASSAGATGTADVCAPGELRRPSVRHAVRQTHQPSDADPHAGGLSRLRRISAALMRAPAPDTESATGAAPQAGETAVAGTAPGAAAADGGSSADGISSVDGSDSESLVSVAASTFVAAVACTYCNAFVRTA